MNTRRMLAGIVMLGLWLLGPEVVFADNCGSLSDCYNTLRAALAAAVGVGIFATLVSLGLDFLPVIGTGKGIIEAITGRDLITNQELAWWERALGILPVVGGLIGGGVSLARGVDRVGDAVDTASDLARGADRVGDVAGAGRAADRAGDIAGAGRAADRAGDAGDAARGLDRTGDAADAAGDTARATDKAEELNTLVNKHGDEARQIVEEYGDEIGGDILRTYDEIADVDGAENLLKDVLAGDATTQGALTEIGYAASLKKQGIPIEKVGDVIDGKKAGDILVKNGPVIDVKNYNWNSRYYQNPNNIEKVKNRILKQVRKHRERYGERAIDYAFTDLDQVPSQILDALREVGVGIREVTWIGK